MSYELKQKKYINFIKQTLIAKNLDNDDNTWENSSELTNFLTSKASIAITDSTRLGMNLEHLLLVISINKYETVDDIVNILEGFLPNKKTDITFLWILADFATKFKFQHNLCTQIFKKLRQKKKSSYSKAKFQSVFYIFKTNTNEEIKLLNVKRYETLIMPPLKANINIPSNESEAIEEFKGYVFTANLYDLTMIYNSVGDELFKNNVRYGIGEQMGVDNAIKDTLKTSPQHFWFRNNGITMLVEEPDLILDRANEIVLKTPLEEFIKFSVINGAQTLSAAIEYYFTTESTINALKEKNDEKSKEKLSQLEKEFKDAKDAKVLLRIIQLKGKNPSHEAQKISISLNRQKPIKQEDIVFTLPFISKLNKFLLDSNKNYSICKRNEISYSINEYSLVEFARARKACSGYPGEARSKGAVALLKTSSSQLKFADKDIFVEQWEDADDVEKVYSMYYNSVLFAMQLANLYESKYERISYDNGNKNAILKNGKWYFVAFVVFIINGGDQDYSGFDYIIEKISEDNLIKLIKIFVDYYYDCICSGKEPIVIDSNTFKSSDNYKILKTSDYTTSNLYNKLDDIFDFDKNKITFERLFGKEEEIPV